MARWLFEALSRDEGVATPVSRCLDVIAGACPLMFLEVRRLVPPDPPRHTTPEQLARR